MICDGALEVMISILPPVLIGCVSIAMFEAFGDTNLTGLGVRLAYWRRKNDYVSTEVKIFISHIYAHKLHSVKVDSLSHDDWYYYKYIDKLVKYDGPKRRFEIDLTRAEQAHIQYAIRFPLKNK